jgi:hypothetical protein
MRQLVELEKVHPDIGMCHQSGQHIGDEPPSRPHLLDLGQRSILDHPEILPYNRSTESSLVGRNK